MPLPMSVATYLYAVTFMPIASAVAGFSPTARRCRPTLVLFSTYEVTIAMAIARNTIMPQYLNVVLSANGKRKYFMA